MKFNNKQLQLIQNTSFFEEKKRIFKSIEKEFGLISEEIKVIYQKYYQVIDFAPEQMNAKITRGENLNGLPFLLLDFPQYFSKAEIFSFRLLFWWGKGFTLFLHLKNDQLSAIQRYLHTNRAALKENDFYVSITGDEWEHDITQKNYKNISEFEGDETINFIKFAFPVPFTESNNLKTIVVEKVSQLLTLLSSI